MADQDDTRANTDAASVSEAKRIGDTQQRQAALDAWQAYCERKHKPKDAWESEGAALYAAAYAAMDFSWEGLAEVDIALTYGPDWDQTEAANLKRWDAPEEFQALFGADAQEMTFTLQHYWWTHRDYWGVDGMFSDAERSAIAAAGIADENVYDARGFATLDAMRAAGHLRSDGAEQLRHILHHPDAAPAIRGPDDKAAKARQGVVERLIRARLARHNRITLIGVQVGVGASAALRAHAPDTVERRTDDAGAPVLTPEPPSLVADWAQFTDANWRGVQFGPASLRNAAFHGTADLTNAAFHGHACLHNAAFHGHAFLHNAAFHGDASLDNAAFHQRLTADRVAFTQVAQFPRVTFAGPVSLSGATFDKGVDLTDAKFTGFEGPKGAHNRDRKRFREKAGEPVPADPDEASALFVQYETAFRTLRKAAEDFRDSRTAQQLHRREQIARRHRRTGVTRVEKAFSHLYAGVANYGEAILLPAAWALVLVPALFAMIFVLLAHPAGAAAPFVQLAAWAWSGASWTAAQFGQSWPAWSPALAHADWLDALTLAYTNTFRPGLVWNPAAIADLTGAGDGGLDPNSVAAALYAEPGGLKALAVRLLSALQSTFTLVCVFLVGLALRRRFQLD